MKRKAGLLFALSIAASILTGCYDRKEVDDMTYVIAMGLDKGTTNNLTLTLQYAIPLNIGGGGGGGGGGGENSKSVSTLTLECPTLIAGLNMANNFVGKELNVAHAKVAVFSDELAKEGKIIGYVYGMTRSRQFRPNMVIAVSRGQARDYIESIKPVQEADPSKYYELKFAAYRYTGFTANTSLFSFYTMAKSFSQQSAAVLVGVSNDKTVEDFSKDQTTAKEKGHTYPLEGDYVAGELPKIGDVKGEAMGLAAFDGDKMVGELDGGDASFYLMATGKYNHSYWTAPDPFNKQWNVVTNVFQSRKPQIKVNFVDGKPRIHLRIQLEGDYVAIQSGENYEDDDKRRIFETSLENQLKDGMLRFLNKTAKNYGSDICGFGRFAKSQFLTMDQWQKFEWLRKYKDAAFDAEVDFKIRRPGLLVRTSPLQSSAKGAGK